jgi:Cu2+-exporting ATPase
LTVSAGALAKDGLLVTRGHAIETLARATHFVFDKTGTLTTGRMHLVDVLPMLGSNKEDCLAIAAALEHASEHPVATALRRAAGDRLPETSAAISEPGQGIEAVVAGRRCRIGRPDYVLGLSDGKLPDAALDWMNSGDTVVVLGDESGCLALFRIGDTVRSEASALIAELRASGKKVILLTGDAPAVARRVAEKLGIEDIRAGVTPQGKYDCVSGLQAQGAVVAMLGDGVNDAPS